MVEVIGLCGYYTMVSMTLNTFEFGLPEGEVSDLAYGFAPSEACRGSLRELDLTIVRYPIAARSTIRAARCRAQTETTCPKIHPSLPARGSGMSISRSPISTARSAFIAACSASR